MLPIEEDLLENLESNPRPSAARKADATYRAWTSWGPFE